MSETTLRLADEPVIASCLEQMRHIQAQIWLLQRYAAHQVACPAGFRGVFEVLKPGLDEVASATEVMARRFDAGYAEVIDTLDAAAHSLRVCDDLVDAEFVQLTRRGEVP